MTHSDAPPNALPDLSAPVIGTPANASSPPALTNIARAFGSIGCLAFGGQGGLLALLSRDLVQRRGWIEEAQITEAFTYVQLLPGAVVVQVVAYLGYRLRGWRGASVASVCFLLPSVMAMLALAAAYRRMAMLAGVAAVIQGLTAAVVGLIALAAYKQARKTVRDVIGAAAAVVVFALSALARVNPAILVVCAGVLGLVREAVRPAVSGIAAGQKDAEAAGQVNKSDDEKSARVEAGLKDNQGADEDAGASSENALA